MSRGALVKFRRYGWMPGDQLRFIASGFVLLILFLIVCAMLIGPAKIGLVARALVELGSRQTEAGRMIPLAIILSVLLPSIGVVTFFMASLAYALHWTARRWIGLLGGLQAARYLRIVCLVLILGGLLSQQLLRTLFVVWQVPSLAMVLPAKLSIYTFWYWASILSVLGALLLNSIGSQWARRLRIIAMYVAILSIFMLEIAPPAGGLLRSEALLALGVMTITTVTITLWVYLNRFYTEHRPVYKIISIETVKAYHWRVLIEPIGTCLEIQAGDELIILSRDASSQAWYGRVLSVLSDGSSVVEVQSLMNPVHKPTVSRHVSIDWARHYHDHTVRKMMYHKQHR